MNTPAPIPRTANRILAGGAATWAIAGGCLSLGRRLAWELLGFLAPILWLSWALAGLILIFLLSVRLRQHRSAAIGALLVAVVAIPAGLWFSRWPLARLGDDLLFRLRFVRGLPHYEQVVAAISTSQAAPPKAPAHIPDHGPPLRIAFPLPGGILDNWEGVVYDPSGEVLSARGWSGDQTFTAPPELQRLFGGDLVACRVVSRPWYRCLFT